MDERLAWGMTKRKKRLRLLAAALCFYLLFTIFPDILETLPVAAANLRGGDGVLYVSGFVSLPEEIREQTVPMGTEMEELLLPDTLEAIIMPDNEKSTEDEGTAAEKPSEESIAIEGVIWTSEPEYDGNTEGIYLFTAVMPEDCVTVEGTALPQIAVTVALTEEEKGDSQLKSAARGTDEAIWADSAQNIKGMGSFQEALQGVPDGGYVVLLKNVSVSGGVTISKSITIISNDPWKPCMIQNLTPDTDDGQDAGRIFTVKGAQLKLENVILDGGKNEGITAYHPLVCVDNNGKVYLFSGTVLQNAENGHYPLGGGAVSIRWGTVYMVNGAVITGCKAKSGGGIEINSRSDQKMGMLVMAGGSIRECEAENGGGVYVNSGRFQMQGGEITCNRATKADSEDESMRQGGGGIYVAGESGVAGVLIIRDSKITKNEAVSNGGGVLLQGPWAMIQMGGNVSGTIEEGGTLEGNKAHSGGGISVIRGNLKLYGGKVTGNTAGLYGGGILSSPYGLIELQGNPRVFGNRAGDTSDRFDNLYLDGNDGNGNITENSLPIRLTGALTDGVQLSMSRWIRPDDGEHPYRDMIVSSGNYTMTQNDINRLVQTLDEEDKQLYADNMEQYAFIPYDGKIVMILSAKIELNKEELLFAGAGETDSLEAKVTPENALIKDVTWHSSDESVARVDSNGVVTAGNEGEAVITATTVSPYHATAVCHVKVSPIYQVTTRASHGRITYEPAGPFRENDRISVTLVPDRGYQVKTDSLRAVKSEDEQTEVEINGNAFIMPDYDVTVTAEFEPVVYPITYDLDGGSLQNGDGNPSEYTILSADITLKNPVKDDYIFKGWTGTDLAQETTAVTIPSGASGARSYTAVWESRKTAETKPETTDDRKEENDQNEQNDQRDRKEQEESGSPAAGETIRESRNEAANGPDEEKRTNMLSDTNGNSVQSRSAGSNPHTGSDMLIWYTLAAVSAFGLLLLIFAGIRKQNRKEKKRRGKKQRGKNHRRKKKQRGKKRRKPAERNTGERT